MRETKNCGRDKELGESFRSDKKNCGKPKEFWKRQSTMQKTRESWEMEKCGKAEFVGENGALKEKKREVWEKDGLFDRWSRLNLPVHLEENIIRPYILYKQINFR